MASWLSGIIFALTYLGLTLGRVPGLRMDRAAIALVGATLMLITGLVPFNQAASTATIDFRTLTVLFGMMIVVGFLRLSGCLDWLVAWAFRRIRTPVGLLAVIIGLCGALSAFLINDIICLALTPLTLRLAQRKGFQPVPHLVALATACNIGSVGTMTGNPQNIYIGLHSGISYGHFTMHLLPVAVFGLVLDFLVVLFVYRRVLFARTGRGQGPVLERPEKAEQGTAQNEPRERPLRWLRLKSTGVALVVVVLFFTGLPLQLIALGAAAALLVGRVEPERVYRQIDWGILVMFTSLFVVVRGLQIHVGQHWDVTEWGPLIRHPLAVLSLLAGALSNIVSNVPAVILLGPVANSMGGLGRETAWLSLAMSSTLAGNLTVLGSIANLIVIENARRSGITISFWQYGKVGIPLTLVTLAMGIAYLVIAGA